MSSSKANTLYKRIVDEDLVDKVRVQLVASGIWSALIEAPFWRMDSCQFEVSTHEQIRQQVEASLGSNLGKMVVRNFRVYAQEFEGQRPDIEIANVEPNAELPNSSTLLIHLAIEQITGTNPPQLGTNLYPKPQQGYGVVFSKDVSRWVLNVFKPKIALLIDIDSEFPIEQE